MLDKTCSNIQNRSEAILSEFSDRLYNEWLPVYCNDVKRQYAVEGFDPKSIKVSAFDAYHFMRSLDHKLVVDSGGGRYRMPLSNSLEVIFWEGMKSISPRPITLWLEPIITFAAIAQLHLDYGWPIDCLGTQSTNYEFDVIAFKHEDLVNEYIAGEVKKTSKEIDKLLTHMKEICLDGSLDSPAVLPAKVNAHRKCLGLRRCRAPYFWAIGPDNDSRLFKVVYQSDGKMITFDSISTEYLHWK